MISAMFNRRGSMRHLAASARHPPQHLVAWSPRPCALHASAECAWTGCPCDADGTTAVAVACECCEQRWLRFAHRVAHHGSMNVSDIAEQNRTSLNVDRPARPRPIGFVLHIRPRALKEEHPGTPGNTAEHGHRDVGIQVVKDPRTRPTPQ